MPRLREIFAPHGEGLVRKKQEHDGKTTQVTQGSNWPFHESRKTRKTASRSRKKARNHVLRKNAKAKSNVFFLDSVNRS